MLGYVVGVGDWNLQDGNVTTVGSAGSLSASFYGTSDQGGNVWEWNDAVSFGSFRVLRGGAWRFGKLFFEQDMRSAHRIEDVGPEGDYLEAIGFRVASPVPSPIPSVSEWGIMSKSST